MISGAFFLFIGAYTITVVLVWPAHSLSLWPFVSPILSAFLGFLLGAVGITLRIQASRLKAASTQVAKGEFLAHWVHAPAAWEQLVTQRQKQYQRRIHAAFLSMAGGILGLAALAAVLASRKSAFSTITWTLFDGFAFATHLTLHLRAWARRTDQDMRDKHSVLIHAA